MSAVRPRRPRALVAALALVSSAGLAACEGSGPVPSDGEPAASARDAAGKAPRVTLAAARAAGVAVDEELSFTARRGTIRKLRVSSPAGALPGEVSADETTWTASDRLEPGTSYTATGTAERTDGSRQAVRAKATTEALTLD